MMPFASRFVSRKTFLGRLSDEEMDLIFSDTSPMKISQNAHRITVQDRPVGMLYVITAGFAKILRSASPSSEDQLVDVYGPGDVVGLGEVLFGVQSHTTCLLFGGEVEVVAISSDKFVRLWQTCKGVESVVAHTLFRQIRSRDEISSLRHVPEKVDRIDMFMTHLAEKFGERRGSKVMVDMPLTKNDIAAALGQTVGQLRPAFKELEDSRRLGLWSRHFYLNDEGRSRSTKSIISPIERRFHISHTEF